MDRFSWGAIVIALVIEAFLLYGNLNNPQETSRNLLIGSAFPLLLIVTVVLVHYLQRGET